jgi:CheY-like chemotaxis protein
MKNEHGEELENSMESHPSAPQGFSGTISLQLSDLVQMVCFCGSDMVIRVHGSSGSGTIHVKGGNLRHAQTGALQGEKAFFEMLAWEDGRFETLPCHDLEVISIEKPWEHLLLEATRLRDEGGSTRGPGFGPDRLKGGGGTGAGSATGGDELDGMDADALAAELDRTFQEMGLFELSHEADTTYEAFQAVEADVVNVADLTDLTDVVHGVHGPRGGCGDSDPDGALEAVSGGAIAEPGASRPLRVLIVDDSPFFARQLKRLLEHDGDIEVPAMAKNGREALDILSSGASFDLMTLDIEMPLMAGDTTLKNVMIRHPIPTIILSNLGSHSLSKVFEFLHLGAVEFTLKPEVHDDITRYGEGLRDLVKRVSKAEVSNFKRLRKSKAETAGRHARPDLTDCTDRQDRTEPASSESRTLMLLGAEGAYMDWLRLPLAHLCELGLVIGLQSLPDRFLPDYCDHIQAVSSAAARPITGSAVLRPGSFHLGNALRPVALTYGPDHGSLTVEPDPSSSCTWREGVGAWLSQLSRQARDRMTVCLLSSSRPLPPDLVLELLKNETRLLPFHHDRLMCAEMAHGIQPFLQGYPRLIRWASPETIVEAWLDHGPDL